MLFKYNYLIIIIKIENKINKKGIFSDSFPIYILSINNIDSMYLKEYFEEVPRPYVLNGFGTTIIKADIQPANEYPYNEHNHHGHQKSFQSFKDNVQNRILFHYGFPPLFFIQILDLFVWNPKFSQI